MAHIDSKGNLINDYSNISTTTSIDSNGNLIYIPIQKKKKEKTFEENAEFIGKNVVGGAWSGVTGQVGAITSEAKNNIQKGQEGGILKNALDIFNVAQTILNPTGSLTKFVGNTAKNAYEAITDNEKSLPEKVGSYLTKEGTMVKDVVNPASQLAKEGTQLYSSIAGKENAEKAYKTVEEVEDKIIKPAEEYNAKLQEEAQEYSKGMQFLGQAANVVGNMAPSIATSLITKDSDLGLQSMGLSVKGNAIREAMSKGTDLDKAIDIGNTKSAIEIGTEMLTGGINIFGKGAIDDIVERGINKRVKNKVANFLIKKGIVDNVGEIAEETISDVLDTLIDKGTVDPDAKYGIEDWSDTAITTVLSTIALNAIGGGYTPKAYKENAKEIKSYTGNEKNVINSVVQDRIDEKEKNNEKYSKKEIEKQVKSDLEKGYISIDEIEKALGGDKYNHYQNVQEKYDELQSKIDELLDSKDLTERQKRELTSLESERDNLNLNDLKNELRSYVNELTQNDILLRNSYNEYANKGQAYNVDLSQIDEKYRDTYQKAMDSGVLNNTNRSHDFVDLIAKLENEKGVKFDFTNNEKLKDSSFAIDGKEINGYVNGDTITLNMDSNEALNQVVGHEITHILEGTDLYDALSNSIKEYVESTGKSYKDLINATKDKYTDKNGNLIGNADIVKELNADLVGKYLFTDEDFVNRLSIQNRNLFQKIYDEIKYLSKLITSGSKEARQLEKLKHTFEKAYRQTTVNQSDNLKLSIGGIEGIKNISNTKLRENGIKNYEKAQSMAIQNISNEEIRNKTGWFQDKNGDWKYEFNDNNLILNYNEIQTNGKYKLKDIIKHDMLFELYPQLKEYEIKFSNMKPNGSFNPKSNLIRINNKYIENTDYLELKGTILHEVQHAIQQIENFESGTSSMLSKKAYYEKLGEIEADDTKQRYINFYDDEARKNIAPESSKINPKHSKYDIYMKNRKTIDKIKDNLYPIFNRGVNNGKNNKEISLEYQNEDNRLVDGRRLLNEELDNSSFSIEKKYRGSHQIENANPITELDIENVVNKIKEIDGYLTKQSESDLKKLKNILNNPNEKVTIYRAAPVNELNSGDWVTTDKAYAKNVANNNGGKVYEYEVNANELYYPDNTRDLPSLHRLSSFQYNENTQNNVKYSVSQDNEVDNYIQGKGFTFQKNGNLEINNLTDKQIKDLVKLYKQTGYEDVSSDYLTERLKSGQMTIQREVADRFIEKELGHKPQYDTTQIFEDAEGNPLTKEQVEFYKDSGVRDIRGRLIPVYHRTNADFTVFDEKAGTQHGKKYGKGFYFSITPENYGNNTMKVYLNAKDGEFKYVPKMGYYIVQESNQIKNIDNTNPTSNEDIRYSISNQNEDIAPIGNYQIKGEDVKLQDIAPIRPTDNVVEKNKVKQNLPIEPTKEEAYENKKTRSEVRKELGEEMGITVDDLEVGKDISSLGYQRTDPIRLNEKVFGAEIGKKINDATIRKTNHNEAERTRFLNKEREEIANLGIKARSKESAAVQKYGEKQYINDKGELLPYGDVELAREFSDTATQDKIKNAARVLRNKYDVYIDEINKVITDMGYDPIPKRPDYMRHFQEINDKLSEWGVPLNRDSLSKDTLPTDINGITDQFKPGKNWFASAMQRKGLKTTYDAITGIDGYLEGASNLIYHTGDIQRYRTLSKMIRDTYGQSHGLDNVDLDTKEGQQRLNNIMDNKLSKYAAWLDEQANALAGKKGGIDRAAERLLGRKIYTIADTAKKQVGSNMTGFNVRSALTNFASAVQGASKTNKLAFIKGTISTIKNIIHNDGLINKSDFLTNRFGSDTLSKKLWQKASNAGQILMTGSDYFTANQIWRSKYYENLSKGMSETEAIKKADDFASRIMGDRSKGMTAEIFNSKTLGLLTQFQLEVNNQWSSIMHDNKMDIQSGNKSGATILFQLGQLAAMSYMFNNFMKATTGSDVMIDPIDILKELFGWNDDEDEKTTLEERSYKVLGDLVNDLPFASFMTGGRIPISEAFTGVGTAFNKLTGQTDKYGNEITWDDVKNDAISSAAYWLLPTGYGQLKKTTKGLSMYDEDLPLPGSYTDSGNLRFNVENTTGEKIKAVLFGEYSSEEAQKYRESGYKTIQKNRLQELIDLNMNASQYRKYREDLNNAGTKNADKIDFISNSNYSDKQKNIMAKNVLNKDFDMKKYKNYGSYEEADYAINNPDKYLTSKQISNSFTNYKKYIKDISELKSDSNSTKKEKIINYIDNLNEDYGSKIILYKMQYPKDNSYNEEIVNYLNNKSISKNDEIKILENLGMIVDDDGTVRW